MTREELIELILSNIERLGIEMVEGDFDVPAAINSTRNIGIWDPCQATPYILAHELIHAKYHDESRCHELDVHNPVEKRALREAVLYLWDIFLEFGGSINYLEKFIEFTGAPRETAKREIIKITFECQGNLFF